MISLCRLPGILHLRCVDWTDLVSSSTLFPSRKPRIPTSIGGATVYAWRTWTVMWYSFGSGTGGYSVSRAPWRQFEDEGSWAGNQCYPRSSLHSSIAATSPCKLPVGTCGAHFVLRDLMAPTLMSGSHPSPWKAIKTRRHHPQAFTGRPAEVLECSGWALRTALNP